MLPISTNIAMQLIASVQAATFNPATVGDVHKLLYPESSGTILNTADTNISIHFDPIDATSATVMISDVLWEEDDDADLETDQDYNSYCVIYAVRVDILGQLIDIDTKWFVEE